MDKSTIRDSQEVALFMKSLGFVLTGVVVLLGMLIALFHHPGSMDLMLSMNFVVFILVVATIWTCLTVVMVIGRWLEFRKAGD